MSILNVNQIQPVGSGQTITISASDITASSATITASSVTANLTGNVTGNVTGVVTSSSGNLTISNGNLVFSTSGTGIDFSATSDGSGTSSSELLDDYEEGTFTPYFIGTTTNPTITYTEQSGRYIKVGRLVYVSIRIVVNSVSGGSGNVKIKGLPYNVTGSIPDSYAISFVYNWTNDPETFVSWNTDDTIDIYRNDSTNTIAAIGDINSGCYTNISGSYYAQ